MANDKFSIQEALKYGWETFKKNIGFFIGLMVVLTALTLIPDVIVDKLFEPRTAPSVLLKLVVRLVGLILGMIVTRISLDIHDQGKADLSRLGELTSTVVPYVCGKLLYGIIVLIGLVLLVIPGIIAAFMFLYVGYLVIDRQLGPIEALQESRVITDGVKMDLFLLSLAIAVLNVIGAVCLFVGLFVTLPVSLMASVYVYRRLSPAGATTTVVAA